MDPAGTAAPRACLAVALLAGIVTPACKSRISAPPVVAAAPAPIVTPAASDPVSVPQTTAQLPPPQPVPPEAIPPETVPQPEVPPAAPPEAVTVPVKPAPKSPRPPGPANTEPARETAAPAPPAAAPPPQLRPLFSAEQERELQRQIDQNLSAAERTLAQVRVQPADKEQTAAVERVRGFIDQARQARQEGDLTRAKSLAERAELLARELAKTAR